MDSSDRSARKLADPGLLADPTRCPDCAIALPGTPPECPACGLPLRGHLAEQLWRVSVAAAGMLEERARLIGRLRIAIRVPAGAPADTADRRTRPPQAQPHLGLSSGGAWLPPPRAYEGGMAGSDVVSDPARPRQMQRLLLGLGVLLLTIAAIIFTVVAWGRVGIGGRSLILATITGAAAWAGVAARRRELPGTAESLALLTTAFLLLDAYGARSADLFGLRSSDGNAYWAVVLAGIAGLGAALWRAHPLQSVRLVAVVAAQLPLLLVGDRLPEPTFAALLCAQGAAGVALARRFPGWAPQALAGLGGALAYAGGLIYSIQLAYDGYGDVPLTAAVFALAFAAVAAATVAAYARKDAPLRLAACAAATAAALFAAHVPMYRNLEHDTATAGGAALLLATFALLSLTPAATAAWRYGPLAVVGIGTLAALAAVADDLAAITSGALGWLESPWDSPTGLSAQQMLTERWTGNGLVPVTLALLTAGATLAAWRLRSGLAATAAGALATATVIALPVAADAPYLVTVLAYVAAGGALLVLAARLYDPARDSKALAAAGIAVAGAAAVGLGLAWAMATPAATVWALVIALATAAAAHVVDPRSDRPAPVSAGALVLVGLAYVLALLADSGEAVAGFVGVVTGSVLVLLAGRLPWKAARPNERIALETAGACAAVIALLATNGSAIWGSNALLAAGTAAALVALLPDRRPVAWLSGILVTASTWLRLAEANVETPEAYTTGPAVALLIAGWWNRRGTPEGAASPASSGAGQIQPRSSWAAYAAGLTMGLLPSLFVVLDEAGEPGRLPLDRPLLLGLAALVVLLVGVRARLQAPLLLGAGVLAVDAVILLAPYAAAVPRWVSIGAAGVLLLGLGATYEKRLRDVRRLKEKVEALG